MGNGSNPLNTVSVWGISDIHIDYQENYDTLLGLDRAAHRNDALIIAGDATDDLGRLESLLVAMSERFRWVGFVPGNHELWITKKRQVGKKQEFADSIVKFEAIRSLCQRIGVFTSPQKVGNNKDSLWLVPLFSWYHGPEENAASLYSEKKGTGCADSTHEIWSDFYLTQWPKWPQGSVADYFLALNQPALARQYKEPVLTFSHFLPLQELIMSTKQERASSSLVYKDLNPEFNFSRVAGTELIDHQIRTVGSKMHLYGHQHRNRYREIDGVTYVSHCMGYPAERKRGMIAKECASPKLLWDTVNGFY